MPDRSKHVQVMFNLAICEPGILRVSIAFATGMSAIAAFIAAANNHVIHMMIVYSNFGLSEPCILAAALPQLVVLSCRG